MCHPSPGTQGCDGEYAKQVTSEHKVYVRKKNGSRRLEWVAKHSHTDNHYLDCEVYAMTAAEMLGVRQLHLEPYKPEEKRQQEGRYIPEGKAQQESRYTPEEDWIGKQENWKGG